SLKTSIKTITYLSDIGCLEIQGASLVTFLCNTVVFDGEELHASYYQSLLSQVRDMVDAL
ncbi:hypothetical protein ACP0HG_16685, partial [Escherichia coli]